MEKCLKHLNLIAEFRELLNQLRREAEMASAMQLYDSHKVAEYVICGLLRELCDYSNMRNLNTTQSNFPSIDLADDVARVAVQVTATNDIGKIKNTLESFTRHQLYEKYDHLIIYILTAKQGSYSQSALNSASDGLLQFSGKDDIWDYHKLSEIAASANPKRLQSAVQILKAYLRGIPIGLADQDIDPPKTTFEITILNMVEVFFQPNLYISQLRKDLSPKSRGKSFSDTRSAVRQLCIELGVRIPSAYVTHKGMLITFIDLDREDNPFRHIIERGTTESLSPEEFYSADENHERVFKSLLRFSLQQRLYQENVTWIHEKSLFSFLPLNDSQNQRDITWKDKRQSTRMVFQRKFKKTDSSKVFYQKHFAFSIDFMLLKKRWFASITPDWFFSFGNEFKPSGYAHDNISWIKRHENNNTVYNHFRFISRWLKSIDEDDIFSSNQKNAPFLSFGEIVTVNGHPELDDQGWQPLHELKEDIEIPQTGKLFT